MLPTLAARLEEISSDTNLTAGIISQIEANLLSFKEEFSRYFPDIASNLFHLVKSPITFDAVGEPETAQEFIEIINYTGVKSEFPSFSETQFWVRRLSDYPAPANIVLNILLRFPTTCECEAGFLSLLQIKTKHRNELSVDDDLRCAVSSTIHRIKKLTAETDVQPSH